MRALAIAYLSTGLVFLAMDAIFLGMMGDRFYRPQLAHLLREGFDVPAAAIFYLIFVGGLVFFSVQPGIEAGSIFRAALQGAAFGFVTYATYDLTNQATLRDWPWMVTAVDMTWGTVLGACAAAGGCAITLRVFPGAQ